VALVLDAHLPLPPQYVPVPRHPTIRDTTGGGGGSEGTESTC
jgi:hypothetical protein